MLVVDSLVVSGGYKHWIRGWVRYAEGVFFFLESGVLAGVSHDKRIISSDLEGHFWLISGVIWLRGPLSLEESE